MEKIKQMSLADLAVLRTDFKYKKNRFGLSDIEERCFIAVCFEIGERRNDLVNEFINA